MFNFLIYLFKKLLENQDIRKYKKNFFYYLLFRLVRNKLNYDLKVKIYNFYIWASNKKNKQSHSILRKCEFEDLRELNLLKEISLTKKIFLFDCGANFGFYSLFVAALKNENKVYSFEASSKTYLDLQKNISLNNFKSIIPINSAVSDTKNLEVEFKESKNDWESSMINTNFDILKTTKIKTTTIDSILENNSNILKEFNIIIKLDVEGHEMNVIKGSKNLIRKYSPMFIIEFSKFISDKDYNLLRDFLQENNYVIYDPNYEEINLEIVSKKLLELPKTMFGIGNNFLIKKNSSFQNIIKNLKK